MTNKKRRTRGKDGRFLADNPETKDVNEAWEKPKDATVSITSPNPASGGTNYKVTEPKKELMGWGGYLALFIIFLIMSLIGLN
jgi:hypothetical protein